MIVSYKFGQQFSNGAELTNSGTDTNIKGVLTIAKPSGDYANRKAMYFDGQADGYISVTKLSLYHTFSVHSWVLVLSTTGHQTLFSKYKAPWNPSIRLGFNALKMRVELSKDDVNSTAGVESDTGLTDNEWTYVVYSIELDTSTIEDSTIKFYKNTGIFGATKTLSGKFIIDPDTYPAYIGIGKNGASSFNNEMNGYIYELVIYQKATTNLAAHFQNSGCNQSASICPSDLEKLCKD